MASDSLVVAHDNQFNKAILNNDTFYFQDAKEVTTILTKITNKEDHRHFLDNNRAKIENIYSWDIINNAYLKFMEQAYEQNR
jgi:hypothetical protein